MLSSVRYSLKKAHGHGDDATGLVANSGVALMINMKNMINSNNEDEPNMTGHLAN